MDTKEKCLQAHVARLETQVDLLESELMDLNSMLIDVGFPEGIATLKATVQELLQENPVVQD